MTVNTNQNLADLYIRSDQEDKSLYIPNLRP